MPLFVLLTHDHPQPHFDFMLETGDVLKTWRIDRWPTEIGTQTATPLPDHRTAYLDYEGPVSGNRGRVQRVDRGEYSVLQHTEQILEVQLDGVLLKGCARLTCCGDHWQFEWLPKPS